jgi:hypothetical protein
MIKPLLTIFDHAGVTCGHMIVRVNYAADRQGDKPCRAPMDCASMSVCPHVGELGHCVVCHGEVFRLMPITRQMQRRNSWI